MRGAIKNAMLSDGYKRYRNKFKVQCKACGCKHCIITHTTPVHTLKIFKFKIELPNFGGARIGFKCLKCDSEWWWYYSLKEIRKEMKKNEL